jgi:tetratricopeptide (TPR) repeat protein
LLSNKEEKSIMATVMKNGSNEGFSSADYTVDAPSPDAKVNSAERIPSPDSEDSSQSDSKGSPTRVLDFDDVSYHESDHSEAAQEIRPNNSESIFRKLKPPAISKNASPRRKNGNALPTLDESRSSSSSDAEDDVASSFEEEDDDAMRRSRDFIGPMMQKNKNNVGTYRKAGNREKIEAYEQEASSLALRGSEQAAIDVYQKALSITRTDVARIKKQLKQVTKKHHPSTVRSIHSRLHEDWLQVGVSIARIRTMMAILFERIGEVEQAIACCIEAREVYKRQIGYQLKWNIENEINPGEAAEQMDVMVQKMSLAQETFEDRKKLHEEIIMWRTKIVTTEDEEMKKTLYRTVEKKVVTVRNLEGDILGQHHPQVGDTSSLLASIAVEQDDIEKALEHMKDALSITRLSLGMKHPRTGEKFCEVARIYEKRRSDPVHEKFAIKNYEMAAEVYRDSSASPRKVGSILNDTAVIHIRQRELGLAVKLLNDALECYVAANENEPEGEMCTDTVQIWRNLGECYASRKEYENAANAFVSALNLQRNARKMKEKGRDNPTVEFTDDESIANTLRRLGKAYAGMKRFRHSLVVLKEALTIHRIEVSNAMKVTQGRANPDLPGKQDQLAHTRFCMAEVHEAIGNYSDAVTLYGESLQLRLFSDAHKDHKKRTNMVHCAMCLSGIGSVHMKQNEHEEARKVFKDALNYCEAHGKLSPSTLKSLPGRLMSLSNSFHLKLFHRRYIR